jgi:serralysin
VGWTDAGELRYQAFDADGNRIGAIAGGVGSVNEAELAGLSGGLLANIRESTFQEPDGTNSVRGSIDELVRTTTGTAANETLSGDVLADHMEGNGGRDRLNGFGGKDTIEGGAGDDLLRGGLDRDQLIGGGGADSFVFQDVRHSRVGAGDFVKDFQDGTDHIDVSAIDAKAGVAGDQAFHFISGGFNAEGQVRAVQDGADTLLQFNTTGASGAEMEIVLKNSDFGDISAADFVP